MLNRKHRHLVLLDQNRLQPWFYYYLFIGIALAWAAGRPRRHYGIALDGIRIMLIGIYLWAGIQKLNYSYVGGIFPWVIEPLLTFTAVALLKPAGLPLAA